MSFLFNDVLGKMWLQIKDMKRMNTSFLFYGVLGKKEQESKEKRIQMSMLDITINGCVRHKSKCTSNYLDHNHNHK